MSACARELECNRRLAEIELKWMREMARNVQLEAALTEAQHLIRDLGGLETARVMGSELCLSGDAERDSLRARIVELKELLLPARDMLQGFSFGNCLAADIDAVLARPDAGKTEEEPNEIHERCFHCGAYVDECKCSGGYD